MPQLRSGRHVAVSYDDIEDILQTGTDEQKTFIIMQYRLSAASVDALRDLLTVVYFREGEGVPPHAPHYRSGFLVKDVLDGKAGWTQEEIDDFATWLEKNPQFRQMLKEAYDKINLIIRESPVWRSSLWLDD